MDLLKTPALLWRHTCKKLLSLLGSHACNLSKHVCGQDRDEQTKTPREKKHSKQDERQRIPVSVEPDASNERGENEPSWPAHFSFLAHELRSDLARIA